MATVLAAFPELPSHSFVATWGDRQVRVEFIYLERLGAWFFSLFELTQGAQGQRIPLVTGRRVSPNYLPLLGLVPEGLPPNIIPAVDAPIGSDPYERADLGEAVRVLLFDIAEIPVPEQPIGIGSLIVTLPSP